MADSSSAAQSSAVVVKEPEKGAATAIPTLHTEPMQSIVAQDWKIINAQNSTYVIYQLLCTDASGKTTQTNRRFRDIVALNEWIIATFPLATLPALPSVYTNPFRSIDSIARDRRPAIESYFQKLSLLSEIFATYEVREFVGHPDAPAHPEPAAPATDAAPQPSDNADKIVEPKAVKPSSKGSVLYVRVTGADNLPDHLFSPSNGAQLEVCIGTPVRQNSLPPRVERTQLVPCSKGSATWNEEFAFSVKLDESKTQAAQRQLRLMLRDARGRCVGLTEIPLDQLHRSQLYEGPIKLLFGDCKGSVTLKVVLHLSETARIQKPFHCTLGGYRIKLDTPVVYAGKQIKGTAIINVKSPQHEFINESAIVVSFYGYIRLIPEATKSERAHTGSPPSQRKTIEVMEAEENTNFKQVLVQESQVVWKAPPGLAPQLNPGVYLFPFQFDLPASLPPSCEFDERASIFYGIKVWHLTIAQTKTTLANSRLLVMNANMGPNTDAEALKKPQAFHPIGSAAQGVTISGSIDANPAIIGEPIAVNLKVENGSSKPIGQLVLKLDQEIQGETSQRHTYSKHREVLFYRLPRDQGLPILPSKSLAIKVNLSIPPIEPPCFESAKEGSSGSRLSLWYQLEATADVGGLPARSKIFLLNVAHPKQPEDGHVELRHWPATSMDLVKHGSLHLPLPPATRI